MWLCGAPVAAAGAEAPADDAATAARLLEGGAAFWTGDYVTAELALFEVLMARPEDGEAHYYLGRIYQSRGLSGRAADHYEAAAGELYPEAFFFLGLVYYRDGRYDDSAARYNKYLEYYPDDAAAWFNLGVTYDAAGRGDEAEDAYLEALAEDPRGVAALHNLAVLYHRRSDFRRAAFFWHRLLEVAPDDAAAYFGLGLAHYYAGDHVDAALAFNEGARLAPFEGRFFFFAARAYFELKKYDLAVGFYKRAHELGFDEGDVAEGMGLAYEGWRRYGEATPLLKKAAELKGEEAGRAYAALGRIEREMGRPGNALANFYEAAARLADAAEAYNQIGELYLEAGLASWAAEAFGLAVEAEPGNLDFNYNLAVARELSEPGRAPEQWRRYLDLAEGVPGEKRRAAEATERLERLLGEQAEGVRP
ncbi:MAG TPA: tetratricopeptide repeat protein [bacterium]|nr:tetratricopeptide repeat protein [bacterium]